MESLAPFLVMLVFLAVFVWARRRSESAPVGDGTTGGRTVLDLVAAGRKIEAIKLYRRERGVGLREAKEAVEALAQGLPK